MRTKAILTLAAAAALGIGALAPVASPAKGMGDMMNPSKWFGGGRDDDYYRGGPGWGYPGGYGYGYPGYGYPGYGWGGVPPYGWGGYPGYGYPVQVAPTQPSQGSSAPAAPPPPQ